MYPAREAPSGESEAAPPPTELADHEERSQSQNQTEQEYDLLHAIYQDGRNHDGEYPDIKGILAVLPSWIDPVALLKWNRTHSFGKDKNKAIKYADKYLHAVTSDKGYLVNDYTSHVFEDCKICKKHGLVKPEPPEPEFEDRSPEPPAAMPVPWHEYEFDLRQPTKEEITKAKNLFGDGFPAKEEMLTYLKTNYGSQIDQRNVGYAMLWLSAQPEEEKITFEQFEELIRDVGIYAWMGKGKKEKSEFGIDTWR